MDQAKQIYYAHTTKYGKETWQILGDHQYNVGQGATARAAVFFAGEWGGLAGGWHDIGKVREAVQYYLEHGGPKVDHATVGALVVFDAFEKNIGKQAAAIFAFIIAGHHTGLPNGGASIMDKRSLLERLHREFPDYQDVLKRVDRPKLPSSAPVQLRNVAPEDQGFAYSFFTRMLSSCVIDADYQDTENFCNPDRARQRQTPPSLELLLPNFERAMSEMAVKPSKNQTIKQLRQEIQEHCISASKQPPGVFSLTVPTGGGKTMSSLAFALNHAKENGLRRIIYVAPFTSIIEQNAKVFRDAVGADAVLEHHSAYDFEPRNETGDDEQAEAERVASMRLASETWDASVIVTTAVQFYESLFAYVPSKCRKLNNIAKSVIILDEAQMLPPDLLAPSVMALRELVRGYGVSIILCTATQPALKESAMLPSGFKSNDVLEIIPQNRLSFMFEAFRRVSIKDIGVIDDMALAERLRAHECVLCIVNTRGHARSLFEAIGKEDGHFHLSALMYPAHRRQVLDEIHDRLKQGKRCRVISTSLIEAGVDIDFPVVYRATTGLDSIAQAAGRCNREGLMQHPGDVFVFTPKKGMPTAPFFSRRADAVEWVKERHQDILSPEAIDAYFKRLYQTENLDAKNILSHLKSALSGGNVIPNVAFRDIAADYHLIADGMQSLIIERDDAIDLVASLEQTFDWTEIHRIQKKLQIFTIQIYPYQLSLLEKAGNIRKVKEIFLVLSGGSNYDSRMGLIVDDPVYRENESNMF